MSEQNQQLESLRVPLSKQDAALLAELERQSPSLAMVAYRDLMCDAEARLAEVEAEKEAWKKAALEGDPKRIADFRAARGGNG